MGKNDHARRFVIAAVLTLGVLICAQLGFAVYLNPWGDYGRSGFHRLYNARRAKADWLSALPKSQLPKVVILGSSNVMRMRPATVERLMGKTAFNYGVFWGRADDFVCIARFLVEDLEHRPDLLIVGLDTWTFAPRTTPHPVFPGIRRRLLTAPRLAKHHPAVFEPGLTWGHFVDAFNPQQIEHGWAGRRGGTAARKPQAGLAQTHMFDTDGTRLFYGALYGKKGPIFDEVEAGTYPIDELLATARKERRLRNLYQYRFRGLDDVRLGYFEAMLELADREDIDVVLVLNPVHPIFYDALAEMKLHADNLVALRGTAERMAKTHDSVVAVVDASQIERFGGDSSAFYDEVHYATKNADLILEQVAERLR